MSRENEYTKAVIYCRVSSDRQVREGHGSESQEHRCRQRADREGWSVDRVFPDEGVSGSLLDRPGMNALLAYLDEHWDTKYVVIFDDLSRLARDHEVHWKLRAALKTREAKVVCLNYEFDDTEEGEFVELIFAGKNALDRKQNRRQVLNKMKARLEGGNWCFCPPDGYHYVELADHNKILAPKQPEAGLIREALEGFAGNRFLTQMDVERFLNEQNYPTKNKSGQVHSTFVGRLLRQRLYAGQVEYTPWNVSKVKANHEALISPHTFETIQAKLNKTGQPRRRMASEEFPLKGITLCACCGGKFRGYHPKGKLKRFTRYSCLNTNCDASPKNHDIDVVHRDFLNLLEDITPTDSLVSLARAVSVDVWKSMMGNVEKLKQHKNSQIEMNEQEVRSLFAKLRKTNSDAVATMYEEEIEKLKAKIEQLKNTPKKKEPQFDSALDKVLHFVRTPADYWQKQDVQGKLTVHRMIFTASPQYHPQDGFRTPELSLPFSLKQEIANKKFQVVEMRGS